MKLTRRGAIGAALGGAAAAAMPITDDAMGYPATPSSSWDLIGAKDASHAEWTASELARLRRIASGDIRDSEKNYPEYGTVEPYDALRSVSPAAKRLMLRDHHERQWRSRIIERAKAALAEYDKTGLLQHVL